MLRALLASAGLVVCLLATGHAEELPLPGGRTVRLPLFDGVQPEYISLLTEWNDVGRPETTLNPVLEWMPDFPTAIEKATRENKPIFMAWFVRENGDPSCDV